MSSPYSTGFGPTPDPDRFLDVSWMMFGELSRALALRVAREYDPEVIVGIARAGVIPGAVIASILRLDFHSMLVTRKEGAEQVRERPAILSAAPRGLTGNRVLIVDEVATSGDTLRLALAAVRDTGPSEVRTATAFKRPGGYRPDYYALETDETIIFPWDHKVFEDGRLVVNPRYVGAIDD
ncbi:MAG: phosphoribosyltransferase [Gemmatimonadetes bacterium]|nr:phosphoribosyltransferase [Gemmatimonadota bacterium]NNF37826.1 phosphoribosyltransferase [Gemmatimonadota bacterium]NNK64451.1 phosphoribosyltransferase [Gemmatimonadota bacterium]